MKHIFCLHNVIFEEGVAHHTLPAPEGDSGDGGGGLSGGQTPGGNTEAMVPTAAKYIDCTYGLAKSHTLLAGGGTNVKMPRSSLPDSESSYASAPLSPIIPPTTPEPAHTAPRHSGCIVGEAPAIECIRLDVPLAMSAEQILTPADTHWVPCNASKALSHGGPE